MHPEQHYLLLGQRGSGKTTLLTRLRYAVEDSAELNNWLIPIAFSEEQYNISELANIWENIAIHLEDYYDFEGLAKAMEPYISKPDFESIALDILLKELDKRGKKIVLFIDNVGDLLAKFDKIEVHRLREILQTKPQIRLIAGSAVVLESILDYQQPLFEFFKVIQLKGLTNEESKTLLRKLAARQGEFDKIEAIIANSPSRIEILRTLAGGVPRTMALLFQVFIDNEHGNAVTDLEKILDAVTPLYKHRMDDLPTQQQKIVDAVARNWDPISVKELKDRLRLESKVISAQLRQLEKNMVIEKRSTSTKNHLYLLRERFLNIWYLMRYGRKQDRQRVIWLVKFLELWCDKEDLENRIQCYIKQVKDGVLDKKAREFYGEVYSFFDKIKPETKMQLKTSTPEYISSKIELTDSDFEQLIVVYFEKGDWNDFIDLALSKRNYSDAQKRFIFETLNLDNAKGFQDVFNYMFKDYTKQNSPNGPLPYFYAAYLIYSSIRYTAMSYRNNDFENIHRGAYVAIDVYRDLLEASLVTDFDHSQIMTLLFFLLSLRQYNIVHRLYEKYFSQNDTHVNVKLFSLTAAYLHDNSTLERLNPEISEEVVDLAKTVIEMREEIEKTMRGIQENLTEVEKDE